MHNDTPKTSDDELKRVGPAPVHIKSSRIFFEDNNVYSAGLHAGKNKNQQNISVCTTALCSGAFEMSKKHINN